MNRNLDKNVNPISNPVSTNRSHNSFVAYCSSPQLRPNNVNSSIISQNSEESSGEMSGSHSHSQSNQSLPPMSTFVATNGHTSTQRSAHQSLLTNQDLTIELLTAPTQELDTAYNNEALDATFVDTLNMTQFVFDSFLADSQSVASHVNNDSEDTSYYSDVTAHHNTHAMSYVHSANSAAHTHSHSQHTNTSYGLTIGPHITDIFSVLESLTETDALTETLLNVNDHYCSEQITQQNVNSNITPSNTFIPQNHDQMQTTAATTIQMPSNIASNQILSNSQPVQLLLSRPSIHTPQAISQPLMQTPAPDSSHLSNHLSSVLRHESPSDAKINRPLTLNGLNTESIALRELIEESKCFKCVICSFISLEKHSVLSHIIEKHKNEKLDADGVKPNIVKKPNTYMCSKCFKGFSTLMACRQHMVTQHKLKVDNVMLQTVSNNSTNNEKSKTAKPNNKEVLTETHNNMVNKKSTSKLRHILPNGKVEAQQQSGSTAKKSKQLLIAAKSLHNHTNNANNNIHNSHMTAKRIAWKRKIKREQGTYICEFKGCSVRFRILENLQRHHRCHSDSGSGFVCCNCSKKTEHWPSMAGHLWRNHAIDLELHACEHCSYRTYSLSILENIHKRIHSNEKNFLCDTCGKGFKNCKQLINHKGKHVIKGPSVKTHECHICLRTFTDARTLKVHLNTVHNKTRPYICSHCNHSAASRSALRTHMRQHTGEKPFKCDKCNYSTSDHNSLRRHKMRHSGERPYKCPFCSYACIQSSTYKQHLKNKHPGMSEGFMFNCEFCGYKTVNQDMYHTHITEHKLKNGEKLSSSDASIQDMTASIIIAPESPTLHFACIVGQSISSQNNTPSISYSSN